MCEGDNNRTQTTVVREKTADLMKLRRRTHLFSVVCRYVSVFLRINSKRWKRSALLITPVHCFLFRRFSL